MGVTMPKATESGAAALAQGFEQTMEGVKAGMSQATAGVETAQARLKVGMDKTIRAAETMVSISQGNVEAMFRSTQIWAEGVQEMQKHVAAATQATFDEAMATIRHLSSVKSMKEAFDLQAGFAKTAMETTLSEAGRLTEATIKLTERVIAPLSARATVAVDAITKHTA